MNGLSRYSTVVASLFFLLHVPAEAQEKRPPLKDSLNIVYLIGTWENVANARLEISAPSKPFSDAKDVNLPGSSVIVPFLQLRASGELIDPRFTNAKWKVVNYSQLVVIPEFSREFNAFISTDSLDSQYRLTISGQTFLKRKTKLP